MAITATEAGWPAITKQLDPRAVPPPNMPDYERARAEFSWEAARRELDGLPGGRGLNVAYEAVDRHVAAGLGRRCAIRWLRKDGTAEEFSYEVLAEISARFANVLRRLGVAKGDRVFAFTGRIPALYVAALGTWKSSRTG